MTPEEILAMDAQTAATALTSFLEDYWAKNPSFLSDEAIKKVQRMDRHDLAMLALLTIQHHQKEKAR
jgi:hypothetical protein